MLFWLKIMMLKQNRFFIIAAFIKLCVAAFILLSKYYVFKSYSSFLWGGDTFSYIFPVDNLVAKGVYAADINRLETYAGRMPGIGIIYLFFRLFLDRNNSMIAFCVFQFLLSFVGLYYTGKLVKLLTASVVAANLSMLLYAMSTYLLTYEVVVLTESLAATCMVIGTYFLVDIILNNKEDQLLRVASGGFFYGWAVFLRPFLALIFAFAFCVFLASLIKKHGLNVRSMVRYGFFFLLPFLAIDGLWIVRNWSYYHRIVPLQSNIWAGYNHSASYKELVSFTAALGYEATFWDKASPMAWFKEKELAAANFPWKETDLTTNYNSDSLQKVRVVFQQLPFMAAQTANTAGVDLKLARTVHAYKESYKKERSFRYYIVNPLKHFWILVFKYGTASLFNKSFSELNLLFKVIKLAASFFYFTLVSVGIIGSLFFWRGNFYALLLTRVVVVFVLLFFCLIFKQPEHRYFTVAYPFVLINFVLVCNLVKDYLTPFTSKLLSLVRHGFVETASHN